jgi:hypothetical protein
MRYGIRSEFPGLTQAQYDGMHQVFAPLAAEAPGFIAHIAGPTDSGWYLMEVWESKSDYESFIREQVLPRMPADAPGPVTQEFAVYSRQTRDQLNA